LPVPPRRLFLIGLPTSHVSTSLSVVISFHLKKGLTFVLVSRARRFLPQRRFGSYHPCDLATLRPHFYVSRFLCPQGCASIAIRQLSTVSFMTSLFFFFVANFRKLEGVSAFLNRKTIFSLSPYPAGLFPAEDFLSLSFFRTRLS